MGMIVAVAKTHANYVGYVDAAVQAHMQNTPVPLISWHEAEIERLRPVKPLDVGDSVRWKVEPDREGQVVDVLEGVATVRSNNGAAVSMAKLDELERVPPKPPRRQRRAAKSSKATKGRVTKKKGTKKL